MKKRHHLHTWYQVHAGLESKDGWAASQFADCTLDTMWPQFVKMWSDTGFTARKLRIMFPEKNNAVNPSSNSEETVSDRSNISWSCVEYATPIGLRWLSITEHIVYNNGRYSRTVMHIYCTTWVSFRHVISVSPISMTDLVLLLLKCNLSAWVGNRQRHPPLLI